MPACGWEIAAWPSQYDSATPADKDAAEAIAAAVLWSLSGRVFGICEETVHPQVTESQHSTYGGPDRCRCITICRCVTSLRRVHLPGPVQSVTSVVLDGVALAADKYAVHNKRWLARTDGERWPVTGEDPTRFTVTYMRGLPIREDALAALVLLAVEYLKEITSSGKCTIPARAQSISRQGVDIQLSDPDDLADAGLTGIAKVDRWLTSVNPGRLRAPSRSYSVDVPDPIRVG
ncbi:hypothetical protein IU459_11845 [Nocardia amamiensis]|uniref:Head-to-tail adaptor n=1 Tax=Nocardia amamiensis TaxID=404578 RepID=A0ABS0CR13_9NOCA|nr:hypothetical protein [Nocardia amamiensis]MBF6298233.1 hypothetical protein [Nocardia amamiensis]